MRAELQIAVVVVLGMSLTALGQQEAVLSPAKGQTPEQMEKDKAECTSIAEQETASSEPARGAVGGRARGAARGAAVGAVHAERRADDHPRYDRAPDEVQEEYRRNQAGEAAAVGAVAGGAAQRRSRRQQHADDAAGFDQAFRSCMIGRGYEAQ